MMTFCPRSMWKEQLTTVLETVATMVPNLEALIIHLPYYSSLQAVLVRVDEKMLSFIGSLEKLKMIRVSSMTIDFVDLKKICKKLQSLIYVDVEFVYYGDLDFGGLEDFRNSFSRLKIFIFDLKNRFHNNAYREEFVKICIGNLPMLQVLQGFILGRGGGSTLGPFPMDVELPSETSSLRHLCINPIARPVHLLFPCVTHLQVHWRSQKSYTEEEINSLLKFSKVECLSLRSCPSEEDLSKFLSAYGKNLHTLSISDPLEQIVKLKFGPISDSCPQLERLYICDVEIVDDDDPFECFSELKYLQWYPSRTSSKRVYLSKILKAPKLETLITSGVQYYDVDDLKKVEKLIAAKQILQELKS
ncbi:Hypothetical predicted protein [Cloeon dipterum]|uniref:FBD domain-containing protein n=1 Tax=Cloeon dipterum TaxID=197152 RepID=A0A8S1DK12_9INSE|nr:Hypothetical predicted protein [Cloeon dipterum]